MTVESSKEVILQDKIGAEMAPGLEKEVEKSEVEQENTQKEDSSEPKEDPRILGLIPELPPTLEAPVTGTKLGPSTTLTPVSPTTSTPTAEATPMTKAAETKQPKRRVPSSSSSQLPMPPRQHLLEQTDDGLSCRVCLQSFWYKTDALEHLKNAHTISELDKFERMVLSEVSLSRIRSKEVQQRRKPFLNIGGRQYMGPKLKSDFQKFGVPKNFNGMSKKYKDLDIKVRNNPAPQAASTGANGLTISRINNFKPRRVAQASPMRPITQNQQIIGHHQQIINRTDRDGAPQMPKYWTNPGRTQAGSRQDRKLSANSSTPFASYVEKEMKASKARTMEWTKYLSEFSQGWETSKARKVVVGLVQKEQEMCKSMKHLLDMIMIEEVADTLHPTGIDLDDNTASSSIEVANANNTMQPNFVVNIGVPGELDRARKVMGLKNNGVTVSKDVQRNDSFNIKIRNLIKARRRIDEITQIVGCSKEYVQDMKRKMVAEMLSANVDVEKISKSLNCSPVLVEKVKGLGHQPARPSYKAPAKPRFVPEKNLTKDQMAKKVLQMIKAKEKAEEICRVVGCERQFVFQVRRDLISELLKANLDMEEISKVLGCGKNIVLRLIKNMRRDNKQLA